MNMIKKYCLCGIIVYLGTTSSAVFACPDPTPPPGSRDVPQWLLNEAGLGGSGSIRVLGLVASTSQEGDTCGIAPQTPAGIFVTSVSVINANTGNPVGFVGFKPDLNGSRHLCTTSSHNCTAFISKVGKKGLKSGTPLELILNYKITDTTQERSLVAIANELARSSTLITAGVNDKGKPERHLSVHAPSRVSISFETSKNTNNY